MSGNSSSSGGSNIYSSSSDEEVPEVRVCDVCKCVARNLSLRRMLYNKSDKHTLLLRRLIASLQQLLSQEKNSELSGGQLAGRLDATTKPWLGEQAMERETQRQVPVERSRVCLNDGDASYYCDFAIMYNSIYVHIPTAKTY